jgi:UDP-N-acetylmuramyl pentapeptide synthase
MARYSVDKLIERIRGEVLQQTDAANEVSYLLIDSRKVTNGKQACFFALEGTNRDGHLYIGEAYKKGVRCFVVSQAVDVSLLQHATVIKVNDTLKSLQELCKIHRDQFNLPVIAITGSNGKTIVKEWLSQILKTRVQLVKSPKSFNSQVGVPLSIWRCDQKHELGIFEAGISKIGTAHDENFENRIQKLAEKFLLFEHCQQLIYCKDDENIKEQATLLNRKVKLFSWSKTQTADLRITDISMKGAVTSMTGLYQKQTNTLKIPFTDAASVENAIHCWGTLLTLGYDFGFIKNGLAGLLPVAMRLELKEGINNCSLINDYYNSDLISLEIALGFVEHQHQHIKKTLILSDILESGEKPGKLYKGINELIISKGITKLIGIGEVIARIVLVLKQSFIIRPNSF